MKPALLFVEDDAAVAFAYSRHFGAAGFAVEIAGDTAAARTALVDKRFDAVILDERLPDGRGLDLIALAKERYPETAVIVITGAGDIPLAVEAMRRGADHFLTKPAALADLQLFIRRGLEVTGLRRRDASARAARRETGFVFGDSQAMARVREFAALASTAETPALIVGETGTGKGLLARHIHDQMRPEAPFVDVNCAALRGELLASELFGHARGAFTSAVQAKAGLLDVAHGGSLFLDELGEMDPAVQSQMLKVIEEKQFRRIGETSTRRSDFRLLAATTRDLEEQVRCGNFRGELLFRVNVLVIRIPPLRERAEDLPALVPGLLAVLGAGERLVVPEALRALRTYDWPGNVRELRNVLERALLLAQGRDIEIAHLSGITTRTPGGQDNLPPLKRTELAALSEALERHGGNARRAAKELGLPLSTFYHKTKALRPKA